MGKCVATEETPPPAGAAADGTIPQGWDRYSAQEDVMWDQLFARQSRVLPGRVGDMVGQRLYTVSRTSLETIADVDRSSAIAECIVAARLEASLLPLDQVPQRAGVAARPQLAAAQPLAPLHERPLCIADASLISGQAAFHEERPFGRCPAPPERTSVYDDRCPIAEGPLSTSFAEMRTIRIPLAGWTSSCSAHR
jgi:hypothetical protein